MGVRIGCRFLGGIRLRIGVLFEFLFFVDLLIFDFDFVYCVGFVC